MTRHPRADYMRDYMRRRRNSLLAGPAAPRSPPSWLSTLRRRYAIYMRACEEISAFQSDALRLGQPADIPAHLAQAREAAEAALDAHAALHPDWAHEYYQRVEADQLRRAADRIELWLASATPSRPRGRPTDHAAKLAALQSAAAKARIERTRAHAAYESALADPSLPPAQATAVQRRWEQAKAKDERAHDAVAALQRRIDAERRERDTLTATIAGERVQLAALREQIATLLAPLPDPPCAPLHDQPDAERAARRQQARALREQARTPAPVTATALAALSLRYAADTDPRTGRRTLVRIGTGRPVRAATVRVPDTGQHVRTLALLDALAPCGLV